MYQVQQQDKIVFQSLFFVDAWLFARLSKTTAVIIECDGEGQVLDEPEWKIDPALSN
jgi:hypothetical protein